MTRRGFLASLSAFTLDPERALWVPGAKHISIPAPVTLSTVRYEEITFLGGPALLFYRLRKSGVGYSLYLGPVATEAVEHPSFQWLYPEFARAGRTSLPVRSDRRVVWADDTGLKLSSTLRLEDL